MSLDWIDTTVATRRAELAAQSAGDPRDPALLLVGGATWSRDWWDDDLCAELVGAGLRVLRYDARDTGASTQDAVGSPSYTAADLVADAVAVLDAYDVATATVLGLSMGGGLVQRLAADQRDRVHAIVLVSTTAADSVERDLPGPTPEIQASFEQAPPEPDWADREAVVDWVVEAERPYAGPGSFDEPHLRELVGRVWDRTPSLAPAMTNHFVVAESAASVELAALSGIPALVVHGTDDPLFPIEHGRVLADLLGAPLLELPATGHQAPPRSTWPLLVPAVAELARG